MPLTEHQQEFLRNSRHNGHLVIDILRVDGIPQQSIHGAAVGLRQAQVVVGGFLHAASTAACPPRGDAALLCDLSLFTLCPLIEWNQILLVGHVTTSLIIRV